MQHVYPAQQEGPAQGESVLGKRAYASLSHMRAQGSGSQHSGQQQTGSGQQLHGTQAGLSAGAPNFLTAIHHRSDGTAVQLLLEPLAQHGLDSTALAPGAAQLLVPSGNGFPMAEMSQQPVQLQVPEHLGTENTPMVIPANWPLPMSVPMKLPYPANSKQQLQVNMGSQAANDAGERAQSNMVMAMLPDGRSVLVDQSMFSVGMGGTMDNNTAAANQPGMPITARSSSQQQQQRHSGGVPQASQQHQSRSPLHPQQPQHSGQLQGGLRPTQSHTTSHSFSGMSAGNEQAGAGQLLKQQQQQQQGLGLNVSRSTQGVLGHAPQRAALVVNKASPEGFAALKSVEYNNVEPVKASATPPDDVTLLGQLVSNSSGDLVLMVDNGADLPDLSQKLVHTPQGPMQLVPLPSSIAKALASKQPAGMPAALEQRPSVDRQQQQQQQRQSQHTAGKEGDLQMRPSVKQQKLGTGDGTSANPIMPTSLMPHPTDANLMVAVLPDGRQVVVERIGTAMADSSQARTQAGTTEPDVLAGRTSGGQPQAWNNASQGPRTSGDTRVLKVARTEPSRLGLANGSSNSPHQLMLEAMKQQSQSTGRASGGTDQPVRGTLAYSGLSETMVGTLSGDALKLSARSLSSPHSGVLELGKEKDGSGEAAQKLHVSGSMQGLRLQTQASGGRGQGSEAPGLRANSAASHHGDKLAYLPAAGGTVLGAAESHTGLGQASSGTLILPASPFEAPYTAHSTAQGGEGGAQDGRKPGGQQTSGDKGEKPETWTVQLLCTDVGSNGAPVLTPLFTLTGRVPPRVKAVLPDQLLVSELRHMKDVERHDLAKENSFLLKLAPSCTPNQEAAVQRMQQQELCLVCPINASVQLVISSLQVGDAKVLMGTLMAPAANAQQQQQQQQQTLSLSDAATQQQGPRQQQVSRSKNAPHDGPGPAAGQTMLQLPALAANLPSSTDKVLSGVGAMGPPPQMTALNSWLPGTSSLAQLPSMATIVDSKLAGSGLGSLRPPHQQDLKQGGGSLQLAPITVTGEGVLNLSGDHTGARGQARRGSANSGGGVPKQAPGGMGSLPTSLSGNQGGMLLLGGPNGPVQLPPGYVVQGNNLVNMANLPAPLMLGHLDTPQSMNTGLGASANGLKPSMAVPPEGEGQQDMDMQPPGGELLALPAPGDVSTSKQEQHDTSGAMNWSISHINHSRQGTGAGDAHSPAQNNGSQRDPRQAGVGAGVGAGGGGGDGGGEQQGGSSARMASQEVNEHHDANQHMENAGRARKPSDGGFQQQLSKGGRQPLSTGGSSQHHNILIAALAAAARNAHANNQNAHANNQNAHSSSQAAEVAGREESRPEEGMAARLTQALQEHQQQLQQTHQRLMSVQAEGTDGAGGSMPYQLDVNGHQPAGLNEAAGSQTEGHSGGQTNWADNQGMDMDAPARA